MYYVTTLFNLIKKMKILIIFIIIASLLTYMFSGKDINNKEINFKTWNYKEAYFAGWCFWCMEWFFEAQKWVKEVIDWYIWWTKKTATYEQVSTWLTKHREWVKVIYNPDIVSYSKLVELYWTQIDPTDNGWQFADRWSQYTTAMFYSNDKEKKILENSKQALENSKKFNKTIATKILPFKISKFYSCSALLRSSLFL